MKLPTIAGSALLAMASALPQAHAARYGDGMPDAQKIRSASGCVTLPCRPTTTAKRGGR